MPYKNKEKQREYQRVWVASRRTKWFHGKTCLHCGSTTNLELHHRDQSTKVEHRIWSWRTDRLETEAQKCDVVCDKCHQEISRTQRNVCPLGHLIEGENKYVYPGSGKIRCKTCKQTEQSRWRRKKGGDMDPVLLAQWLLDNRLARGGWEAKEMAEKLVSEFILTRRANV